MIETATVAKGSRVAASMFGNIKDKCAWLCTRKDISDDDDSGRGDLDGRRDGDNTVLVSQIFVFIWYQNKRIVFIVLSLP